MDCKNLYVLMKFFVIKVIIKGNYDIIIWNYIMIGKVIIFLIFKKK